MIAIVEGTLKTAHDLARLEIGTVEWGDGSNPKVVAYFRDAGHPEVVNDETAWCAAFVGAMLYRAGIKGTGSLLARSYLKWGDAVSIKDIRQGDIGIIPRGGSTWQGHVFFIDKIANGKVYALGGNQRDAVNIQTYPVASLIGVRRATSLQKAQTTVAAGKPATTPIPDKPKPPATSGLIWATLAALWAKITKG